jgi:hypothetical protein
MAKLLNPDPVHVVMVPVSPGMAQRIEANPSGLRVAMNLGLRWKDQGETPTM